MSAERPEPKNPAEANALTRRHVFAGAGAVGALAAVAAVVPLAGKPPTPVPDARVARDTGAEAEGYRLSDHVLRYYETARV